MIKSTRLSTLFFLLVLSICSCFIPGKKSLAADYYSAWIIYSDQTPVLLDGYYFSIPERINDSGVDLYFSRKQNSNWRKIVDVSSSEKIGSYIFCDGQSLLYTISKKGTSKVIFYKKNLKNFKTSKIASYNSKYGNVIAYYNKTMYLAKLNSEAELEGDDYCDLYVYSLKNKKYKNLHKLICAEESSQFGKYFIWDNAHTGPCGHRLYSLDMKSQKETEISKYAWKHTIINNKIYYLENKSLSLGITKVRHCTLSGKGKKTDISVTNLSGFAIGYYGAKYVTYWNYKNGKSFFYKVDYATKKKTRITEKQYDKLLNLAY